ncbi:type IX secretion system protein PorQ [Bacteroidales bacterium OttesenSCG-928-M06]|nr:type IX secretion system protein PorQ [Bacteroidales bacterium OttesenSCG-928-M06]
MYRFFLICLLCSLYFTQVLGQAGKSSFDYLLLPHSARSAALGGNNVSIIENDISLVYDNPGAIGIEMDLTLTASYMAYVADIGIGNVAFAKSLGEKSAIGIGAFYGNYGKMKEAIEGNVVVGDLNASDICGSIFFAHDLTDKLRGGITGKFFYSNYHHNTAIGLGVDLGLSYYHEEKQFSLGLVGKNIGRQIKAYEEDLAGLPWDIQFGFTKKLAQAPIRVSVTGVHLKQWKFENFDGKEDSFFKTFTKHLIFGVDFIPNDNFWIGLGYNVKRGSDMSLEEGNKLGGFSAGAGLRVKAFSVGCSVGKYNLSATSFMVSISTSFAEMKL